MLYWLLPSDAESWTGSLMKFLLDSKRNINFFRTIANTMAALPHYSTVPESVIP